jgi:hypothetical protein
MAAVLHFYTLANGEIAGYSFEGITCRNYLEPHDGAVALRRWVYPPLICHYYTTKTKDMPGWDREKNEGYVFTEPRADLIPIYHFWNEGTGDNFYTADFSGELALGSGYKKVLDDMFYAFPPDASEPGTVPFRRFVGGTQQYCVTIYGAVQAGGYPVVYKKTIDAGPQKAAEQLGLQIYNDYRAMAIASGGSLKMPANLPEGLRVSSGGCN